MDKEPIIGKVRCVACSHHWETSEIVWIIRPADIAGIVCIRCGEQTGVFYESRYTKPIKRFEIKPDPEDGDTRPSRKRRRGPWGPFGAGE